MALELALIVVSILGTVFVYMLNDLGDKQKQLNRLSTSLEVLHADIARLEGFKERSEERLIERSKIAAVKYQAIRDEFSNIKEYLSTRHNYTIRKNQILDSVTLDDNATLTELDELY